MNKYKRIEIPLGWKCNEKCFFCSEIDFIRFHKGNSIKFKKFYQLLIKYYKKGYNHLTIVGGEPTIEKNFIKSIKLAKKLGMGTQISTNGLKFVDKDFTKKTLKYLDWITLSIHTINNKIFKKITQTNIKNRNKKLLKIIKNIEQNQEHQKIRINCVLNQYNINKNTILNIIKFLEKNNFKYESITLTYPDITVIEKKDIKKKLLIYPKQIKRILGKLDKELTKKQKRKIVLADMPFCFITKKRHQNSQDNFFDKKNISKIHLKKKAKKQDRDKIKPRGRFKIKKCKKCKFKKKCPGFPKIMKNKSGF